jgi:hypothetical protein
LEKPAAACEPGPDSELDAIVKAAND